MNLSVNYVNQCPSRGQEVHSSRVFVLFCFVLLGKRDGLQIGRQYPELLALHGKREAVHQTQNK